MPRYKHGKVMKTITPKILGKFLERVDKIDCSGYPKLFIKALIVALYWSGFRISEFIGGKGKKVVSTKTGEVHYTEDFPPLNIDQIRKDENYLWIRQVARKGGKRRSPINIPLDCEHVDILVKWIDQIHSGKAVFPIPHVTFWKILKRIDPKLYPHYFILNRLTLQARHPEISMAQQEDWSGKSPQTIAIYRAEAGRDIKKVGDTMRETG